MFCGVIHLARWLVVALDDKLYAIRSDLEAHEKLQDIQLACIIWQTLDLDHTVALTGNWLQRTTMHKEQYFAVKRHQVSTEWHALLAKHEYLGKCSFLCRMTILISSSSGNPQDVA